MTIFRIKFEHSYGNVENETFFATQAIAEKELENALAKMKSEPDIYCCDEEAMQAECDASPFEEADEAERHLFDGFDCLRKVHVGKWWETDNENGHEAGVDHYYLSLDRIAVKSDI